MSIKSRMLLHPDVLRLAQAKGVDRFTEVQEKAFPLIIQGESVLLIAPTGFGKTEAAMLPILSRLVEQKGNGVQVLYLTPLRALNRDMLSRLHFYCRMLGLRLGVRHGDTSAYERLKQKAQPPQLLISTPESLNALLVGGMRDSLKNLRFVIVDEVHELAYSKRGVQLSLALARLRRLASFQTIGLSATVYAPSEVASFLGPDVRVVDCSHLRALHLEVVYPQDGEPLPGFTRETSARLRAIEYLVKTHSKTLLFVNTRFMAEALGSLLQGILGDSFAVHHSSLSKEARVEVEEAFKAGPLKALVCTSSLELGMDIGDVDLVIQIGSPRQVTRLVQRVGRSGHRFSSMPKGVIIALDSLDQAEAHVLVDRAHKGVLEKQTLRPKAFDVLAHQFCGLVMEYGVVSVDQALQVFRTSILFSSISLEELRGVINQLASSGLVAWDGAQAKATRRTPLYYYENLSTIPDEKRLFVKNAETNKNVALLDEAFVANYLTENASFIARGKAWKVLSIIDNEIVVEPSRDASAAIPDWVGEEIPVGLEVAQEVARRLNQKPSWELEVRDNVCLLHSFLGHKANESLAKTLSILFSLQGVSVRSRASAYSVLFEFPKAVPVEKIHAFLHELRSMNLKAFLETNLLGSPLFLTRFTHVSKRFGFLRKDRDYAAVSLRRLAEVMKDSLLVEEAFSELFYDKLDPLALQQHAPTVVETHFTQAWSVFAKHAMESGGFAEFYAPAEPTEKVVAAFAEDLRDKRIKLRCGFCKQSFSKTLGAFTDAKCIFCKSTQIMPDEFFGKKEDQRVASLVSAYGQKALYALSAYGVGPETASRVLARLHKTETDLFYDLLAAQKDFIRTKRFWKP